MGPCIAHIFPSITNKMQRYTIYLFTSVKCCTCFRRYLRPSSEAQNCIYSIANIFPSITNKMQHYTIYLFISVKCSTCFRRYLRPSSGAQNCIYSIWHLSNLYCCLPQLELVCDANHFQLFQDSGRQQ
jgi:hypothetical protein